MTLDRKLEDEVVVDLPTPVAPEPPPPETQKSRRNAYMARYMRLYRAKKKRALHPQ